MQNEITNFGSAEIVEYAPACTLVNGKTVSERRLSVLPSASFDGLADRFSDRLYDLQLSKNGGYVIDKKTGISKPNAKRKMLDDVIRFIKSIQQTAAEIE